VFVGKILKGVDLPHGHFFGLLVFEHLARTDDFDLAYVVLGGGHPLVGTVLDPLLHGVGHDVDPAHFQTAFEYVADQRTEVGQILFDVVVLDHLAVALVELAGAEEGVVPVLDEYGLEVLVDCLDVLLLEHVDEVFPELVVLLVRLLVFINLQHQLCRLVQVDHSIPQFPNCLNLEFFDFLQFQVGLGFYIHISVLSVLSIFSGVVGCTFA